MQCPECKSRAVGVKETRIWDYNWLRRRRYCQVCKHKWHTLEIPEEELDLEAAATPAQPTGDANEA